MSRLALARIDFERTELSASVMTNWMPRVLGSMMLRPGAAYVGATDSNNQAVFIPFVFSNSDTALIECTNNKLRFWESDSLVTRPAVTAAVTNGDFTTDLTGWTDADDSGATSSWSNGKLALTGDGFNYAKRYQEVTVNEASTVHALRIVITRGPVNLKVGTSAGDDSYISTSLDEGTHSLAFTPSGNFFIQFEHNKKWAGLVDSVAVEANGVMEITSTWAAADLDNLRYRDSQSGDIIFVACAGQQQRKIERRGAGSWSYVKYQTTDGPYRNINTTTTTIAPSALTGYVTLTASKPLFESTHVGALFRIGSIGQQVSEAVAADPGVDLWTNSIRVVGVDASRKFLIEASNIDGTGTTITVQRSVDNDSSWADVESYTTDQNKVWDDLLDNQIIYYRIGIKNGDYSSGTAFMRLTYSAGSIDGVVRIESVTNSTTAAGPVLVDLGVLAASDYWWEGQWSDYRGWPTAGAFYEGRLWWAGKDKINGSITDSFYSFDDLEEGDSAPISRSIGSGPVDTINWILPSKTLLVGADGAVFSARSNSFEEPLTRTNFNLRRVDTQGCLGVQAVDIDNTGIFVQASGQRVYEMKYDTSNFDYGAIDLTAIVPELCDAGIAKVVEQRQPDTRIHFVLEDGTVAILVRESTEEVKCWLKYETDGTVEDAVVLPGTEEDEVYYIVNRTVNSGTVRYLEKWAKESECKGAAINKLADCHYIYSGGATTTITGLSHLEGETVAVWGNTKDLGTYTVASGQITVSESVTYAIIGLVYTASWKSVKLAYASQAGTALLQKKRACQIGFMAADIHSQGIKYGRDFNNLFQLPQTKGWKAIDTNEIYTDFDEELFIFPGNWDTDARICLRATAPRPATLLAMVFSINTHDKI
jgi:hypothetical protein